MPHTSVENVDRYAPGARVEVRDEEWMIRSVVPATTGGHALTVVGVSDLVRGREAIFVDQLDKVQVLDPRETELEADSSAGYRMSRLYLESLMRQSPVTGNEIVVGHRGALEPSQYQLEPTGLALSQPRARILIADGVGLGKTVEVGILLSELIRRGRGRRILVVALRSVLEQFQMELWSRFTIPLVRLDSAGIERVQRRIPASMNPFYVHDRVIISIDTLKRDEKYRRYLRECEWDAIVIDECQHVAERTTSQGSVSQRAKLAKMLAETCDSLILASATPHDGRPESFASLMNLLDPTAVPSVDALHPDTVKQFVVRRFKKDIEHEVAERLAERELIPHRVPTTEAEESLLAELGEVKFKTIGRLRRSGGHAGRGALFSTLLRKGALSSPQAVASTIEQRRKHTRLRDADDEAAREDIATLEGLAKLAAKAGKAPSKVAALVELLESFGISAKSSERVVVFSERRQTLEMLQGALSKALKLGKAAVEVFDGGLADQRQQEVVKGFGQKDSPIRVLLCSDAAAEGINLHFYCHRLVHYDIPWSFITLEQRNGRIDRFGQTQAPQLHVLLTVGQDEAVQGDMRVLERLVEKENEAHETLGDVRALLGLQEAAAEEEHLLVGREQGVPAEELIPEVGQEPEDFLAELLALTDESEAQAARTHTESWQGLFADDLAFFTEGWRELTDAEVIENKMMETHPQAQGVTIRPPEDLALRFESLPPELRLDSGAFKLTVDRKLLMAEFQAAREREEGWPQWHLLWDQHPAVEWLTDRLVAHMTRHAAPVIRVPRGLEPGESFVLFQGILSNRRSQPVLAEWFAVRFKGSVPAGVVPWEGLRKQLQLDEPIPNDGRPADVEELLALREAAVDAALEHMHARRETRAKELGGGLKRAVATLRRWKNDRLDALEAKQEASKSTAAKAKLERQVADTDALFEQRNAWYQDTMSTEDNPYLRLAAVFVPQD